MLAVLYSLLYASTYSADLHLQAVLHSLRLTPPEQRSPFCLLVRPFLTLPTDCDRVAGNKN